MLPCHQPLGPTFTCGSLLMPMNVPELLMLVHHFFSSGSVSSSGPSPIGAKNNASMGNWRVNKARRLALSLNCKIRVKRRRVAILTSNQRPGNRIEPLNCLPLPHRTTVVVRKAAENNTSAAKIQRKAHKHLKCLFGVRNAKRV